MNGKQKKVLIRIIITAILYVMLLIAEHALHFDYFSVAWAEAAAYLVPYIIIGYDIILKAGKNISRGHIFDENFLMMIATFGAFAIGEYSEALAVMLFYQTGELFQGYAVGKSRKSIADMMDICPEYANVEEEGRLIKKDPEDVIPGTIIIIRPGERVPLDGIVVDGESLIDTAALTGEAVPRSVRTGESIISGCINGNGMLKVKVTKSFENSTVSKILELVENAGNRKARVENFITRFARYYTPFVTITAFLLAVIPSVITGNWTEWLKRACIFLVVSCPCALVISVPLGFFSGIGAASSRGILIKGSNFLEAAAGIRNIVFDKTGTLTKGEFSVTSVISREMKKDELLKYAALAESCSTHPIALSIKEAYGMETDTSVITSSEEIPGHGIKVMAEGRCIIAGNAAMFTKENIDFEEYTGMGTMVYIAIDGKFSGTVVISDSLKPGTRQALAGLKNNGVTDMIMLTGDRKEAAAEVAELAGIDKVYAELLPGDKVRIFEEIMENSGGKTAFVGDGINDAPVLTRADVGFAMGSMGSDAAIEAADIVIMDDDIGKIVSAIKISRKTMRIVKQNIVFALGIKLAVLAAGAFGIANMWCAVFADVGVSVIAILNSMRMLGRKNIS